MSAKTFRNYAVAATLTLAAMTAGAVPAFAWAGGFVLGPSNDGDYYNYAP